MDTTEETHDGEMPSLSFQIVRGVIAGALIATRDVCFGVARHVRGKVDCVCALS